MRKQQALRFPLQYSLATDPNINPKTTFQKVQSKKTAFLSFPKTRHDILHIHAPAAVLINVLVFKNND